VETNLFIDVLKNYSESSEEEAIKVLALKESFPYSQILHALSARMSKDHGFTNQNSELQLAAVYAADRSVLKNVMTLDALKPYGTKSSKKRSTHENAVFGTRTSVDVPATQDLHPGSLADEVMIDLEKLHQLRQNFEMMFPDGGNAGIGTVQEKSDLPKSRPAPQKKAEIHSLSAKTKKERIIELAKSLEAEKESAAKKDRVQEGKKKKIESQENILDEIASTKHKIEPENEKQKHQLDVIDQFIKTQPSISRKKDLPVQAPASDLTTIKSGEFSDNVVSETLVEILVRQGKNDKAIEVLKKLIWKFPQKKSYFAAQIEELKK